MQTTGRWLRKWAILWVVAAVIAGSMLPVFAEDAAKPATVQALIGMYGLGTERVLVRELAGQLELLYNTEEKPESMFAGYAGYPLQPVAAGSYRLLAYGPLRRETATVRFERDKSGRGVAVVIGAKNYRRQFFDVEEGRTFQIKPLLPTAELRIRALSAVPPVEKGDFMMPDLVELSGLDATIRMDIRYATTNNFMGIQLYDEPRAFLQKAAAEAVTRVHVHLRKYGYGLIVYDAYRPWYVTKMFWDATPDHQKVFVADPSKGSRHNRGGAVDLGLYQLQTGEIMDMGSDYDEFSIRAYPAYPGGTDAQRKRRDLLRTLMEGEGFTVYPEEWWHFDYSEWRRYPILNRRFNELQP